MKYIKNISKIIITSVFLFNLFLSNVGATNLEDSYAFEFSPIIINEFMPNPEGSDGDYEWIEIYNWTNEDIDLSAWTIDDNHLPEIFLEKQDYLVISKSKDTLLNRYPNLENIIELPISLKNSSDIITLENDVYSDIVEYSSSIEGVSWERINKCSNDYELNPESNTIEKENENHQDDYCLDSINYDLLCSLNNESFSENCSSFINEKLFIKFEFENDDDVIAINSEDLIKIASNNYYIEVNDYLQSVNFEIETIDEKIFDSLEIKSFPRIHLNEIMPNPEGTDTGNEWIELFNNNLQEYDLSGWFVSDNSSTSSISDIQIINNFGTFTPDLSLNNSNEQVYLYTPSNLLSDKFRYDSSISGQSFSRNIDGLGEWVEDFEVTKNMPNKPKEKQPNIDPTQIISIENAKNKDIGDRVTIKGIATSKFQQLGSNNFYIQDNSSGIKIYIKSSISDQFNIEIGKTVTLNGELEESRDELQVYIENIDDIQISNISEKLSLFDLSTNLEKNEGELIKVEGEISKSSGTTFYINPDNQNYELKVSILKSTGIDLPEKSKGDRVEIVGIISQWGTDSEGNPNYRLLPRSIEDITIYSHDESKQQSRSINSEKLKTLSHRNLAVSVDLLTESYEEDTNTYNDYSNQEKTHDNTIRPIFELNKSSALFLFFSSITIISILNIVLNKEYKREIINRFREIVTHLS